MVPAPVASQYQGMEIETNLSGEKPPDETSASRSNRRLQKWEQAHAHT